MRRFRLIVTGFAVAGASALGTWYSVSNIGDNTSLSPTPSQPAPNHESSRRSDKSSTATPPNDGAKSSSPSPPATQPQTYVVKVYFSKHPESDNDPARVFAVTRQSPSLGVANFAVTETLKGPTAAEKTAGYFTTVRLRNSTNAQDFRLSILNGTATLQFMKPFDHLGVVADGQASSELKASLLQFGSVKKVIILNYQGNCEFDLSGMNLCLQQ
jgi:hypothetical protein